MNTYWIYTRINPVTKVKWYVVKKLPFGTITVFQIYSFDSVLSQIKKLEVIDDALVHLWFDEERDILLKEINKANKLLKLKNIADN